MIWSRAWRLGRSLRRQVARARRLTQHAGYSRYLDSVPASLDLPASDVELLALDLETDGLDVESSSIVQIGWVPLRLGDCGGVSLEGAGQVLVAGAGELDPKSVVVHGITESRRARGVSLDAALDEVFGMLQGRVLVAHHAGFERSFLTRACRQITGAPLVGATVCTLELERRWFPGPRAADGFRLGKLRSAHHLPHYPAHEAFGDALSCAELLLAQVARHQSQDLRLVDLVERV